MVGCRGERDRPDKVVNVEWQCPVSAHVERKLVWFEGFQNVQVPATVVTGDICKLGTYKEKRQSITVRSSAGGSYVVSAPEDVYVNVGDNWPLE